MGLLEDQAAIVRQTYHLAWILDHRAWERVGEVLAPDAVAYGQRGRQAVIDESFRRHLGGCGPSQHLLSNHVVDVDGDRATSRCYARVYHQGAGDRADRAWECMGEYHDGWARTPDGWRMVAREFEVRIAHGDFEVLQPG